MVVAAVGVVAEEEEEEEVVVVVVVVVFFWWVFFCKFPNDATHEPGTTEIEKDGDLNFEGKTQKKTAKKYDYDYHYHLYVKPPKSCVESY